MNVVFQLEMAGRVKAKVVIGKTKEGDWCFLFLGLKPIRWFFGRGGWTGHRCKASAGRRHVSFSIYIRQVKS